MSKKKSSDKELFQKAKPEIFQRGRELRKEMTSAEKILWDALRGKKLNGLRFRRQHPMSRFILDFYCHEKRLVIELDGEVHDSKEVIERDESRTIAIGQLRLKVIRFKNEEVLDDLDKVIERIKKIL